jgi:hypothetical protein
MEVFIMPRKVLLTILNVLNIKNSYAAKVIGLTDGTFSLKLKNYKNNYRFFDDEISLMINKIFYERLYANNDEHAIQTIKKASKAKELAEVLYGITQDDPILSEDKSIYSFFSNESYSDFIISFIWREQIINNKYYRSLKEGNVLKKEPV